MRRTPPSSFLAEKPTSQERAILFLARDNSWNQSTLTRESIGVLTFHSRHTNTPIDSFSKLSFLLPFT